MAANPVLVDSSFYIRCLRENRDPLPMLGATAASRDLAICGVVRCEVARGLRRPETRAKFTAFWNVMLNVPTDNRLWDLVEQLSWDLDRKGIILPLTDIIIGCCALRIQAVVLTCDNHFYDIPGLSIIHDIPV